MRVHFAITRDFSGLGVVHIRLKESLPDEATIRVQGGSFGSYRTFFGYSPVLEKADAFLAYEGSRTDGPFQNPLRYNRDARRVLIFSNGVSEALENCAATLFVLERKAG